MSDNPIDITPYIKGGPLDFRVGGPEPDFIVEDELVEGVERLGEALRGVSISMDVALENVSNALLTQLFLDPEQLFSNQERTHGMTLEELIPETIEEWKQIKEETND